MLYKKLQVQSSRYVFIVLSCVYTVLLVGKQVNETVFDF